MTRSVLKPGEGANTDWMDEVTRVGKIQDYNLDISSGGVSENAAKYFLSFNYFKNEAIIIGKDLERFSRDIQSLCDKWDR